MWTSESCLPTVLTFSGKQIAVAFDSGPDSLMGRCSSLALDRLSRVGLFQWPCPFPRTRIPLPFSREGSFSIFPSRNPHGSAYVSGQLQAWLLFLHCFITEKDLDGTSCIFLERKPCLKSKPALQWRLSLVFHHDLDLSYDHWWRSCQWVAATRVSISSYSLTFSHSRVLESPNPFARKSWFLRMHWVCACILFFLWWCLFFLRFQGWL